MYVLHFPMFVFDRDMHGHIFSPFDAKDIPCDEQIPKNVNKLNMENFIHIVLHPPKILATPHLSR